MGTSMSLDFLIACIIRESERRDEPIWFNRLERILEGKASRSTISRYIDKLFDYGIIYGEWGRNADGDWVRTFHISGEASTLVERISKQYQDDPDFREACTLMDASS